MWQLGENIPKRSTIWFQNSVAKSVLSGSPNVPYTQVFRFEISILIYVIPFIRNFDYLACISISLIIEPLCVSSLNILCRFVCVLSHCLKVLVNILAKTVIFLPPVWSKCCFFFLFVSTECYPLDSLILKLYITGIYMVCHQVLLLSYTTSVYMLHELSYACRIVGGIIFKFHIYTTKS